jgi:replication factor C subunit 1
MLTHKYKPDNLENIIGNKTCINSIQLWFENWYPLKTNSKDVCVLLSGPNGIGKTLTVELLIEKYNLNPISLNPDEKADKEHIVNVILPSIQRKKSFTNKQNIFVIHDIDCYDDYGFISSIVNCLKETKIPVIATCNNRYDQSLKLLIAYCLDVKFQKPNAADVVKFVKPILKKQSISMSDANLNQLIEDSNCDIRSILNNLELFCGNVNINTKDKTNSNIFEVTKQFMSQSVELNDKQILDLISYYYPDIEIEKDKYICKIKCSLWDKQIDIQVALDNLKDTMRLKYYTEYNNVSNYERVTSPIDGRNISIYDAYNYYCRFFSTINGKLIVSKSYFEKYIMEILCEYIIDSKYISSDWIIY